MKIERAYKKLLIESPFYGLFLLGLSKVIEILKKDKDPDVVRILK